ncbi:Anaphase-promoting complex subunit 23, partial [Rhizopus stolonifer]
AAEILDGIHGDLVDNLVPFTGTSTNIPTFSAYCTDYDSLLPPLTELEYNKYQYAKTLFQLRQFNTVVDVLKEYQHPKLYFLRLYSKYLVGEKKREEFMQDVLGTTEKVKEANPELNSIYEELHRDYIKGNLDAFGLYLYGMALGKRKELSSAAEILIKSLHKYEYNWSVWMELGTLVQNKHAFIDIKRRLDEEFETSVMKEFFLAKLYVDLQYQRHVFKDIMDPLGVYFPHSTYILSQWAMFYYESMDYNEALVLFEELRDMHPSRLEYMDVYSNVLYLLNMKDKLCSLAFECKKSDMYRPETWCVLGNYYVLKNQVAESIEYFKRAIKMNKSYNLAWNLLGHSYIEIQQTRAAIECYRRAVEINDRDYRAWYGLGQAYVIMQCPSDAMFYYQKATDLRPEDGRMWKAIAECCTLMRKEDLAENYYRRAEDCDEKHCRSEMLQIEKIFERRGKTEVVVDFYHKLWEKATKEDAVDERIADIGLMLARHAMSLGVPQEARQYASSAINMRHP